MGFPWNRRGVWALVVCAGAALAPALAAATPEAGAADSVSPAGSYLAGRFAQQHDDWTAAAAYMARALDANPGDLGLLRRTYVLALSEGRLDAALGLARRLQTTDGDPQLSALLLLADAVKGKRLDEAATLAAALPVQGLGKYIAPMARAWLAVAQGRTDDALQALAPLEKEAGFSALYHLHSGLILDLAGRSGPAEGHYAAVTAAQSPLRVVQVVGSFFERTGRADKARALYEAFLDSSDSVMIEPALRALETGKTAPPVIASAADGLAEALFDLGSALHHEGAEETALLFGRIALHLQPNMTLARLMVADVLDGRERPGVALADYQVLAADPALGWVARLRAADVLARLDRTDEAIAQLQTLTEQRPDRTEALVRLGDLYRARKDWQAAADTYTRALDRIGEPEQRHWAVYYARALAWDGLKRWPETEADLKKAMAIQPDEPYLLNYLGYSWIDRGINLDEAKAMVARAVDLRPKDGYIMDSLGWALYRLGDYEGAVSRLEKAVELKPLDPTINDHLGDAYWRVGRRIEARFQWQRALRTAEDEPSKQAIAEKLEKGLAEQRAAAVQDAAPKDKAAKDPAR